MTSEQNNPWEKMSNGTRRRVEFDTEHDFFWITNYGGDYGFYIRLFIKTEKTQFNVSLKGIEVFNNKTCDEFVELYFILKKKIDWQIFYILCKDIVSTVDIYEEDSEKLIKLKNRLMRWKNLLANKGQVGISTEKQMGLFSELYCLLNTIGPYKGYDTAMESWVAPYQDKQDFILKEVAIEVKSHRVSKGNYANISSVDQLITEKDKLYIISYGLTLSNEGETIDDLYNKIIEHIDEKHFNNFRMKLFEVGWIPNYADHRIEKFIIDSETIYFAGEKFPMIKRNDIDIRIKDIRYRIDLSQCEEYITNVNELFGGE